MPGHCSILVARSQDVPRMACCQVEEVLIVHRAGDGDEDGALRVIDLVVKIHQLPSILLRHLRLRDLHALRRCRRAG